MRQLVYSLSSDKNLVPFHLWWREILLKREKVFKLFVQNWRISYKKEVAAPENWVFWKKYFLLQNSCFKRLLSFHYNRYWSGNIAALTISLSHGDWCSEIYWKKVRWRNWIAANIKLINMHSTLKRIDGYKYSKKQL